MAIDSITAFVSALRQSRILDPARAAELARDIQPRFSDAKALAWHLLDRGWITTYQINQLIQGHVQDLVLGDYVLLERLGEGGMGQVFKARRAGGTEAVALKVIRPELLSNVEAVRQFTWEIQVLSKLSHDNIVRTLDASQVHGQHFFAMEYVEGTHLERLVRQTGPLPVLQACDYIRQAALGLEHAREHGLIHRDIKPANLLLVLPPEQNDLLTTSSWESIDLSWKGTIKILDWGLASLQRAAGREDAGAGDETLGTADYLAPEQATNPRGADIRTDIYGLGCTLYFLLTGQPPFPGGSIMQKLLRHQQEDPMPVAALRQDMPDRLGAMLQKMMSKRVEERYLTPAALAAALAPLCGMESPSMLVQPRTPSRPVEPVRKFSSRSLGKERRSNMRHLCRLESACRAITSSSGITWPAEMLDVSRGGLAMVLGRRFEPGTLLDITLPTVVPHSSRTLMVRVKNVRKQPDGRWVIGCAFANELSDEELWSFRAERVRAPSQDCRAWFRVPGDANKLPDSVVRYQQEKWPAQVLNISPGGAALQVKQAVEGGALLRLELQGAPDDPPLMALAHVIHATAQPNGDWLLGCAFATELTDEELHRML